MHIIHDIQYTMFIIEIHDKGVAAYPMWSSRGRFVWLAPKKNLKPEL